MIEEVEIVGSLKNCKKSNNWRASERRGSEKICSKVKKKKMLDLGAFFAIRSAKKKLLLKIQLFHMTICSETKETTYEEHNGR